MTDEQIIQKAREAGMTGEATPAVIEFVRNLLEAEIEACAKVCDGVQDCGPENGCCPTYWNESLERAAAAIRARKSI